MNYKVTNTKTGASLVTNDEGFKGLIASHTANMGLLFAALEDQIIREEVAKGGWENTKRGIRIEETDLPVDAHADFPVEL